MLLDRGRALTGGLEVQAHHLAETGRVVVADGLRVAKRLQNGVTFENGFGEGVEPSLRLLAVRFGGRSAEAGDRRRTPRCVGASATALRRDRCAASTPKIVKGCE
eukprot:scaffold272800_cov32-Tisochrysis_lutea.AAC.1